MTTRETSFRESDHPGIVFPGNVLSGENDNPGNDCKPFAIHAKFQEKIAKE